jgi:hypothetical protein
MLKKSAQISVEFITISIWEACCEENIYSHSHHHHDFAGIRPTERRANSQSHRKGKIDHTQ